MASKSLIKDLGTRYVREFFNGALFQMDGDICMLRDVAENIAYVHVIDRESATIKWKEKQFPAAKLVDFSTFRYPKLGYRQYKQGKVGNVVVNLTATRNTQRGLKNELLSSKALPIFDILTASDEVQGYEHINSARRAKEIFEPTFTPFYEGIKQLIAGDIAGFAVSEDLAVGMSVDTSADRGWDVYFRGRVVGNVDQEGRVNIINKILQRDSIKRKIFK